jgi:nitrogen regulatory protein P-II 1
MKEISIFVRTDDLARLLDILKKHNVGGIAFHEVNGAGRVERKAVPEMVRMYQTGRLVTPEHHKITKLETVVSDSAMNPLVDDISNNLRQHGGNEAHGMIFVKEVADAFEIGTKHRGEAALTSK